MRICVFVKPVHQTAFPLTPARGGTLDSYDRYAPLPNPTDEYALEMALSLREGTCDPGATVSLCSAGGPTACETVLRELLACGADRALWIRGTTADPDGEAVARSLLAAFRDHRFDVALFGVSDSDTDAGEVGPMFSALSGIAFLAPVTGLRPAAPGRLEVTRKEGRLREEFRVQTPICLGVLRGKPLRYPSYWGKRRAARAQILCLQPEPHTPRIERVKIAGSKPRRTSAEGQDPAATSADKIRQALGLSAGEAADGNRIEGTPEQVSRRILHVLERENLRVWDSATDGADPG